VIHLGHETAREPSGFIVKHCILCLTPRLHAVEVSSTELAGFTYGTKAFLVCQECGFDREVVGDAARAVIETAVPREAIEATLVLDTVPNEFADERPAGSEWLLPQDEPPIAA
jgi:hypothetical protein